MKLKLLTLPTPPTSSVDARWSSRPIRASTNVDLPDCDGPRTVNTRILFLPFLPRQRSYALLDDQRDGPRHRVLPVSGFCPAGVSEPDRASVTVSTGSVLSVSDKDRAGVKTLLQMVCPAHISSPAAAHRLRARWRSRPLVSSALSCKVRRRSESRSGVTKSPARPGAQAMRGGAARLCSARAHCKPLATPSASQTQLPQLRHAPRQHLALHHAGP